MIFGTIFLMSFGVSFAVVPVLINFASERNIMSMPGRRHVHIIPTPTLGGLAIIAGVLIISPFLIPWSKEIMAYFISSWLILLLGVIDDVKGASWKVKLFFSLLATTIFMKISGLRIHTLGDLLGTGRIDLGILSIPFTYFAIFGVMNAINLIDGLNGLACGVSSIIFLSLSILGSASGNNSVCLLSLANLGATLGLFRYNYPRASIFMGDSGSLFLGFSAALLSIMLTQSDHAISPMLPVLIMAVPIFDTLRVMALRAARGRHPFRADRTHIHHVLMQARIRRERVVHIIWVLTGVSSVIAFLLSMLPTWIMFYSFVIIAAVLGLWLRTITGNGKRRSAR